MVVESMQDNIASSEIKLTMANEGDDHSFKFEREYLAKQNKVTFDEMSEVDSNIPEILLTNPDLDGVATYKGKTVAIVGSYQRDESHFRDIVDIEGTELTLEHSKVDFYELDNVFLRKSVSKNAKAKSIHQDLRARYDILNRAYGVQKKIRSMQAGTEPENAMELILEFEQDLREVDYTIPLEDPVKERKKEEENLYRVDNEYIEEAVNKIVVDMWKLYNDLNLKYT